MNILIHNLPKFQPQKILNLLRTFYLSAVLISFLVKIVERVYKFRIFFYFSLKSKEEERNQTAQTD